MARTLRWLAAIALAVTAAVASGAAAGADAAQAPAGWQLTAVYPVHSGVDAITAAAPVNAWAAENCTRPCRTGSGGVTLRHWNGRQWVVVKDPAVFSDLKGAVPVLAMNPGATSPLWALSGSVAVRWTGRAWAAPIRLRKGFQASVAVAPSSSDVWALGQTNANLQALPYAERYNGRTWAPAPAPPLSPAGLSATSPSDVWAIGAAPTGVPASLTFPMIVSHWTGSRWATTKLPSIGLYDGSYLQSESVVADGPHNAWAFGQVQGEQVPSDPTGMQLYRWNGATWSQVTVPYPYSQAASSPIFSDGRGGIWFWAQGVSGGNYLAHDSGSGTWSQVRLPMPPAATSAQITVIEPIPGSTSLWAGGFANVPSRGANPGGTEGLILRHSA